MFEGALYGPWLIGGAVCLALAGGGCARTPDTPKKSVEAPAPVSNSAADVRATETGARDATVPPEVVLSEKPASEREQPPPPVEPPAVTATYAFKTEVEPRETLLARVPTPGGFERVEVAPGSFGAWLRTLPLKPGRPDVLLFDGSKKRNQSAHAMVVDIDTGKRDLQQCADAVMRLRAEYLYSQGRYEDIHFNFTTGDRASYSKWRQGFRPQVRGNEVSWAVTGAADTTYAGFRNYLTSVFTYAGTASLTQELDSKKVEEIAPGDVFIIGGYPGHAILVLDVAKKGDEVLFLVGQSYMPAQDMHLLKNPNDDALSPWYSTDFGEVLRTPEWDFKRNQLKRFRQ